MTQMRCCIKKDLREVVRTKKTVLFGALMLLTSAMVLGTTLAVPSLMALLVEKAPEMVADGSQIHQVLGRLFPQTAKENLGIWASDIVIFFTIAIALVCCNVLPEEIKSGKWILVKEAGYSVGHLLLSKMVVYGVAAALPVFVGGNVYYALCRILLTDNYTWAVALGNSVVLAVAVFFIVTLSVSLSVVYRNHITAVITMIATILAAPDILTMFSFGKLFPTYLLTFTYNASADFVQLVIPAVVLLLLQVVVYRTAVKRLRHIEVAR